MYLTLLFSFLSLFSLIPPFFLIFPFISPVFFFSPNFAIFKIIITFPVFCEFSYPYVCYVFIFFNFLSSFFISAFTWNVHTFFLIYNILISLKFSNFLLLLTTMSTFVHPTITDPSCITLMYNPHLPLHVDLHLTCPTSLSFLFHHLMT